MTSSSHTSPGAATDAVADPREQAVTDRRPWGAFRQYTRETVSTVKIITVEAGETLSLQRHRLRDELWVALDAGLEVRVGDDEVIAQPGDEFFVPRGTLHRVGATVQQARFLEIAFGAFDEDDIERVEDAYGRR